MTTFEFTEKLNEANTLNALIELRKGTGSPTFVSQIKKKICAVAPKEGYVRFSQTMTSLRNVTLKTKTNELSEVIIPDNNRTFGIFKNKKVSLYINDKTGYKTQTAHGFVKEVLW